MAEIELKDLKHKHEENEKKLKLFLLPKDEADKKNAIIEIRAGTVVLKPVCLQQIFLRCMKN